MEAFAEGITGAKAALYQILYLQTPVTSLPFHQDHDHFFLTEYNRTHLNYWIPLVKPSPTEAGLRVIPWDRLREKSLRVFNLCRRAGASRLFSLRDGGTLYSSDWSGGPTLALCWALLRLRYSPEARFNSATSAFSSATSACSVCRSVA